MTDPNKKLGKGARPCAPTIDFSDILLPKIQHQSQGAVVPVAIRDTKGMSVSFSIEAIPPFRKPPKFGGTGKDSLWQIDDNKITGDLEAIQDSSTHVSILPRVTMLLDRYELALAQTQDHWEKVD